MTAIDDKYASFGGEGSYLHAPTTAEMSCPDGVGRFRHYQGGSIYWHPMSGAHVVQGAIRGRWEQMGWERSVLGYPLTDESDAARGGKFNHFMGGSIFWSAATGAREVYGPIWDKWRELKFEISGLGFPVSDVAQTLSGELRQRFQGGLVGWTPQGGTYLVSEPQKTEKVLRVFLVRFSDVPNPPNYTRDFFHRLFFSANEISANPEGGQMPGSVFDYFYGMSDGYVRLVGEVVDWTDNPFYVTQVKHWYSGMPDEQWRGGLKMLAAVVAPTLRLRGVRTLDDLRVNGRVPDGLVFYHTDVWGGGQRFSMANVRAEVMEAGRPDLWDNAWDAWSNLPALVVPCCELVPAPMSLPNGTFGSVPDVSDLRWHPSDVVRHELGHMLFDFPDLTGWEQQWWTVLDVMSYPPRGDSAYPLSSYLQERGGWFNLTDMPRRTHPGLVLDPFETHGQAMRFQSGPPDAPEAVVLEARARWDSGAVPPRNLGNVLFAYRVDPYRRQAILLQDIGPEFRGLRRTVSLIRRPGDWGEVWGTPGYTNITGQGADLGNSLNHLGERWWEFRNIQVRADGSVQLDAVYQPVDLIRGYTQATWTNGGGQPLRPDFYQSSRGQVMLVNRSQPIEKGLRYNRVLSLHPNWEANGKVSGRYLINVPAEGARLYLVVALSEQAVASDGFTFRVISRLFGDRVLAEAALNLERNIRTLVINLSGIHVGYTFDIVLEVEGGPSANRDWAYLLEAELVPMSRTLYDFVEGAQSATWRGNTGAVAFNLSGQPQGEASRHEHVRLQNGCVYGGGLLFTHPAWRDDGFIEGEFPVTLPPAPSVFRAEVGFAEERRVTDNGARVSARFIPDGGTEQVLLPPTLLERRPAIGEVGLQQNPVTSIAAPIPGGLRGASGRFILRVEADGSATQDWVYWPMARLTAD